LAGLGAATGAGAEPLTTAAGVLAGLGAATGAGAEPLTTAAGVLAGLGAATGAGAVEATGAGVFLDEDLFALGYGVCLVYSGYAIKLLDTRSELFSCQCLYP